MNKSTSNAEKQDYLRRCEHYLSNPEHIEPAHLAQYLASNSQLGLNDHVCSILQHYFYNNIKHALLFRYIQLLDCLISHCFPLPRCFPHMFAHCYQQAARMHHKAITQQMQVMRKVWTPLLQDGLIDQLRALVHSLTNIDIEIGLPASAKAYLEKHFSTTLQMGHQEIDKIINKFQPMPLYNAPKLNDRNKSEHGDSTKKRRKQCQDTEDTEDNNREKASLMLNMLKNNKAFSCKQCGQCFQTEKTYESHRTKHFKRRLIKYKIKSLLRVAALRAGKMNKRKEKTVQQWIKYELEEAETIRKTDTRIAVGSAAGLNESCDICGNQFRIEVVDDELVYKQTVEVVLCISRERQKESQDVNKPDKVILMHGECYLACIQC